MNFSNPMPTDANAHRTTGAGFFPSSGFSRARFLCLISAFCFLLSAFTASAANVRTYFINTFTGDRDTNYVVATKISSNILSSGGVIAQGIPTRLVMTNGASTNFFASGFYSLVNSSLGKGVVINVSDNGAQLYDYTNLLYSGFNTYVVVYGSNLPPTYDNITNALGFLPLTPTQTTNAILQASNSITANLTNAINGTSNSITANMTNYVSGIAATLQAEIDAIDTGGGTNGGSATNVFFLDSSTINWSTTGGSNVAKASTSFSNWVMSVSGAAGALTNNDTRGIDLKYATIGDKYSSVTFANYLGGATNATLYRKSQYIYTNSSSAMVFYDLGLIGQGPPTITNAAHNNLDSDYAAINLGVNLPGESVSSGWEDTLGTLPTMSGTYTSSSNNVFGNQVSANTFNPYGIANFGSNVSSTIDNNGLAPDSSSVKVNINQNSDNYKVGIAVINKYPNLTEWYLENQTNGTRMTDLVMGVSPLATAFIGSSALLRIIDPVSPYPHLNLLTANRTNGVVTISNLVVTGTITGNGSGLSNSVDIIAGSNITVTTNANKRSYTIASTGGSSVTFEPTQFGSSAAGTNILAGAPFTNTYTRYSGSSGTQTIFTNTPNTLGAYLDYDSEVGFHFVNGRIYAPQGFSGIGSLLTALNASELTSGTVNRNVTNSAVKTGDLVVTNNATISGNLSVAGTFTVGTTITTQLLSTATGNTNRMPVWGPNGNLTNVSLVNLTLDTGVFPATLTASSSGSAPTLSSMRQEVFLWDELIGKPTASSFSYGLGLIGSANSGTVSQSAGEATAPGIVTLSTSTSASASPALLAAVDNYGFVFGSGNYTNEWRFRVPTLATAAEGFSNRIGFAQSTGAASSPDGVWCLYDTNDTHFVLVCRKDNTETRATNTTTLSANTWYKMQLAVLGTTNVIMTVDGTDAVSVTNNIPTTGDTVTLFGTITKVTGTTARTLGFDYCALAFRLYSSR